MAILTTKTRAALPKSAFGQPGKRAYPMPDASHAANAKARATQAVKAGRMSAGTEHKIDAKANKMLGAGHHGGLLGKSAPGPMGHAKQSTTPISTDRGSFGIKG
jgi:hypothetical protein